MSETNYAGTSAPPATVVCARCGGAIQPGFETCPTCGAPQSRPAARSGAGPGPIGLLLILVGMLLPLAWLWPDMFRHVGLGWLSDWLEAGGHRMTMMVPIWFTVMLSYGFRRHRSRAAMRPALPQSGTSYAATSGRWTASGAITRAAGAPRPGSEVRPRAQHWLFTLDTLNEGSTGRTRLRCAVVPRRDFHFALLPQNRVLRALTSPKVGGFLLSLGQSAHAAASEEPARRHALEAAAFMVSPPIELGEPEFDHAFLLKSDDPAAARALFGDQRGPLLALCRPNGGWQLMFMASVADASGQLEFCDAGMVRDAARLDAVQQAMTRMLDGLAAGGFITADSPASNP